MELQISTGLEQFRKLAQMQNRALIEQKKAEGDPVWMQLRVFGGALQETSKHNDGGTRYTAYDTASCYVDVLSLGENRLLVTVPDDLADCSQLAGDFWADFLQRLGRLGLLEQRRPAEPAKPEEPEEEPKPYGGDFDAWFGWYHRMKATGFSVTLRDVAEGTGYAYGTVKKKHAL